jgi:DNA-binding SARP family transcriptional activator/Tfp pilus assembly protein PilF
MGLNLNTLGRLEISWNEQPVTELTLRKSQALLVYLAFNSGHHERSHLAGLLWGELPERNARRNLRHALHTLRAAIDPDVLESDRLSAGLNPIIPCDVDALHFTSELRQARSQRQHGELDAAFRHLQRAVDLYLGDFLDTFDVSDCAGFEAWVTGRRVYLSVQFLEALEALVNHWTKRGIYDQALRYARRQLALEPLSEAAHRQLMVLLALTGQRNAAVSQYQTCRRILDEELGLEPLEETRDLYRAIRDATLVPPSGWDTGQSSRTPLSLPFVGREEAHAVLVGAWEAAQRGEGRLTLVEGEAGVGKTRLLDEVLRYVEAHGSKVLRGRCYEFGGSLPYQPIAESLRVYFREERLDLSPVWIAELSRLLPSLHERYPDLPEITRTIRETARQRLFEAVARLLVSVCSAGPALCLFIDDLHWADLATLDLLHYLVRQLDSVPLWIVCTYRPEETGWSHPLTRLRQGLSRDHRVLRLTLDPLTPGSVQQLAQSLVGENNGSTLGSLLYQESEGNAFFLAETVRAMQEEGALVSRSRCSSLDEGDRSGWTWSGVRASKSLPVSVQDVILQRVGRLSDDAQGLLTLAAVAGQPFDASLLRTASAKDENAVEASLNEWLERHLIQPQSSASGGLYDFSHDKIRAVLYHQTVGEQRQVLHRRLGEALERRLGNRVDEHASSLAYHFERAGFVDKALVYLPMAAAKAAAVYASDQALDDYQRALDLCPLRDERRWRILLQQADIYRFVGHYEEALASCRSILDGGEGVWRALAYGKMARVYRIQRDYVSARECAEESERLSRGLHDPERRSAGSYYAQALQTLGEIEREQSNYARAQALFESALTMYKDKDDVHGLARCHKGLGEVLLAQGRYDRARRRYEQAVEIFRDLGDKQNAAVCLRGIGMACWRMREYDVCRRATRRSLDISQEIGDRLGEAASLNTLGLVAIVQGDQHETQRCLNTSVAIYRELGLERRTAAGLHNLGISYMDSGDMGASRRCLEQALAMNRAVEARRDQALDLGWLGKLHWLRKDYATAARYLDRALELDRAIGGGEEEDWHLIWRTAVACEGGNLQEARGYLRRAEQMLAQGSANIKAYEIAEWHASIELAEGNLDAAERLARQALTEAQTFGASPTAMGEISVLLGRILGSDPPVGEGSAGRYFEDALALLPDAVPTMYARAMALYHYGIYLDGHDGTEQARLCFSEARAIFERVDICTTFMVHLDEGCDGCVKHSPA